MALLPILNYPDPRLRTVAKEVEQINDDIKNLIQDMFETMYDARGIGLAATQVDRHVQVVVMDLAKEGEKPQPKVYINPKVTPLTEELTPYQEGCLSIPEVYDTVERPARVRIEAMDEHGQAFSTEADGLLAVCIQHELDHLKGIVFVDHLSSLKQSRARDKVKKVLKTRERAN
ncbi:MULTISPECIES: peptide deformylase [unclassified Moraxella]|uniref:peptide deformylase n=1 Tax=unclassified Moraxella TaxID=2685852 RepID=UPI002B417B27|nr:MULTISPECIES: peptide deformylase [unclassified Moraxella]